MARLAAVPERRAAFREERRMAALTEPLVSSGRLTYRRPSYLEKDTTWPQPERLVIDGNRVVITAGNDPPRVVDLGSQPELRGLVDALRGPIGGDLPVLQRGFRLSLEGSDAAWRLELTPTDPRAARVLRVVRIQGAGADPREITVTEANGDEQRLLIEPLP